MSGSEGQEVNRGTEVPTGGSYAVPSEVGKTINKKEQSESPPVYDALEMGIRNIGYQHERTSNRASSVMQSRAFSPYAVDTPIPPSYELDSGVVETSVGLPIDRVDANYLKPIDGESGHQYEDLAQMAAKLGTQMPGSDVGGPRKKANVLYEPTELKNGNHKAYIRPSGTSNTYDDGRWSSGGNRQSRTIFCFLLLIGLIAVLALVIAVLGYKEVVNDKECPCTSAAALSSKSSDPRIDWLINRVRDLEANLTLLRKQLDPRNKDIEDLRNRTDMQRDTMNSFQARILKEEMATNSLNSTVMTIENKLLSRQFDLKNLNTTIKQSYKSLRNLMDSRNAVLELATISLRRNLTNLTGIVHTQARHIKDDNDVIKSGLELINSTLLVKVQKVSSEVADVRGDFKIRIDSVGQRLNDTIKMEVASLQHFDTGVLSRINLLNTSLLKQIQNISTTPGPAGPPGPEGPAGPQGSGNFSTCRSVSSSERSGAVTGADRSRARVNARRSVTNGYIVMGASCSSPDARRTYLQDQQHGQFACICEEASIDLPNGLLCYLQIWECPLTS